MIVNRLTLITRTVDPSETDPTAALIWNGPETGTAALIKAVEVLVRDLLVVRNLIP